MEERGEKGAGCMRASGMTLTSQFGCSCTSIAKNAHKLERREARDGHVQVLITTPIPIPP